MSEPLTLDVLPLARMRAVLVDADGRMYEVADIDARLRRIEAMLERLLGGPKQNEPARHEA